MNKFTDEKTQLAILRWNTALLNLKTEDPNLHDKKVEAFNTIISIEIFLLETLQFLTNLMNEIKSEVINNIKLHEKVKCMLFYVTLQ